MNEVEKYVHEVYDISRRIKNLGNAASSDVLLTRDERADIQWEIARLKSAIADAVASLIAIANKDYEP